MPEEGNAGQVPSDPQSTDANGQVPNAPISSNQTQDPAASTGNDVKPEMTLEEALDALKKARQDAASRRVDDKELKDLRAYKAQQDEATRKAEEAKLPELEREQKARAEAERRLADLTLTLQETKVRSKIEAAASALNVSLALVSKLVDFAAIEFDPSSGDPTNVADLVKAVVTEYDLPRVAAAQQPQTPSAPPQPTSVGTNPGNPARSGSNAASGALTREYVDSLTPEQYANLSVERRTEIKNWNAVNPRH